VCDSLADCQPFLDAGIPTRLIVDTAIGVVMDSVDLVLVGAEGVMENGGVVNKVGTYPIALVANALSKPFYVAVESYKFARMYPLSQRDTQCLSKQSTRSSVEAAQSLGLDADLAKSIVVDVPSVDFTPAKLITLLFTDLGVLTPAAVSDELIRLYQ
jgi:translation initiation factor eIF-2B subunit alpha